MSRRSSYALILLVLFQTAMVAWWAITDILSRVPYRAVQLLAVDEAHGRLNIFAEFVKTTANCDFIRVETFGVVGDKRTPLAREVVRAVAQAPDRVAGYQTMRLAVDLGGAEFDAVSVVTRHDCAGRTVDREMLAVDMRATG